MRTIWRARTWMCLFSSCLVLVFAAPDRTSAVEDAAPQRRSVVDSYRIVNVYPHDASAFTQGLLFSQGVLYESTGRVGQSSVRKVRLETGAVIQQRRVDAPHFAEGLAELNGRLIQLTWQSGVAFVYDRDTLEPQGTFAYPGEGWGLTTDGRRFILSDGSNQLRFFDSTTFRETGRVSVTDAGVPVRNLNELEFVDGEIYANIWHSERIARIAPETGVVKGWIDLAGITAGYRITDPEAVLNGIAHDPASGRLFVTGKLWPRVFEIEVVPRR